MTDIQLRSAIIAAKDRLEWLEFVRDVRARSS
jgi:hypothetical protein